MGARMRRVWGRIAVGAVICVTLGSARVANATAPSPFGILANSSAWAPRGNHQVTVLVGDSLIWAIPAQPLADHLSNSNGRSTWVAASAGASTKNFVTLGWLDDPIWGGPDLTTIYNYNVFFGGEITVVALGSNDARIMTSSPSTYGAREHAAALGEAIVQAKSRSTCVFLVNVANHWDLASSASVAAVNNNIDRATRGTGGRKVYKIDWAAHSAGHESWFAGPRDIHHSAEGKLHYAELINRSIRDKINAGLC